MAYKIDIKPDNKGLLHKKLGIAKGTKIPRKKLAVNPNDSAKLKKEKVFAQNAAKWNK